MTQSLFDLTGKVVAATGGNGGLGLGFLQGCARQGADVVIWARNSEKSKAACATLLSLGARRATAFRVDVADEASVQHAMADTVAEFGRVDCVFANAGVASVAPSFPDMTTEMWRALMVTNLDGGFFTLREAARHMRARAEAGDAGGSIVACGSLSIFAGIQGLEHYGGAKGALASVIKGMAAELGRYGVRANMIAPGYIATTMASGAAQDQFHASRTPLGRVGRPSDLEGVAAYLASDASSFHSGDIIVIDGGWMASLY